MKHNNPWENVSEIKSKHLMSENLTSRDDDGDHILQLNARISPGKVESRCGNVWIYDKVKENVFICSLISMPSL